MELVATTGICTPAPEAVYGERDAAGRTHYDHARAYYRQARTHPVAAYDVARFYDRATDQLTELFYVGDRAQRESGFDPSGRFGPFSVDILRYNPVCLNTLLCRMERDLAAILALLDRPRETQAWSARAKQRAQRINRLLWDATQGLYVDYDFEEARQSTYRFLTTFYPLWAGIATKEQAAQVVANLPLFERAGGLQTSDRETGNQWDAPFGWGPLHVIATRGLRCYGYHEAANRIAIKFLTTVLDDFAAQGTIKEKYDVCARTSAVTIEPSVGGYTSNEVGFGWTNAAVVVLHDDLACSAADRSPAWVAEHLAAA